MKNDNIEYTPCPICKSIVEIDVAWAKKNQRVFCNMCGKAFDIKIQEDTEEKVDKEDEFNW